MKKITDVNIKQEIIEQLSLLPVYYASRNNIQHTIRCPYCGDSQHLSHAHFSLRINIEDDLPLLYRCLRCNESGMVSRNTLFDLGITLKDEQISVFDIYCKKSKRKYQNRFSDNMEDFYVPRIEAECLAEMKAFYINNRIGSDFSIEDMRRLKIVLSMDEFCKKNKVKLSVDKTPMRGKLESSYVGFLSTNNNRIMCRNINSNLSKDDFRWYNVILNENNLNQYTFYSIPSSIDLYYTHDINVHIAEGAFDILSIYNNVMNKNSENNFYYASCGSSSLNILSFLIDKGINTGLNIHLYSDKDKSDYFHMKYIKHAEIHRWCDSITIHRNAYPNEKDFGVTKEKIIDSYRTIYRR